MSDPLTSALVQFGAVGVIAAMLLAAVRILYVKLKADSEEEKQQMRDTIERERRRGDRLEEDLRRLNEAVRSDYLNTISRATAAVVDSQTALAAYVAQVRQTRS